MGLLVLLHAGKSGRTGRRGSAKDGSTETALREMKQTAQRAQNRRQKHVCFYLFRASWRPVFLFEETEFLCKKQIDSP